MITVDKVKGWLWGTRRRRLLFIGTVTALPWLVGSSFPDGPDTPLRVYLLGVLIVAYGGASLALAAGVLALLVESGRTLVRWIRGDREDGTGE